MRVKRLGYVGMRTSDVEGMTHFLRDVLGLEAAGEDETVTFQRLPTHRLDFVEVYSQEHDDVRMIPAGVDFMIAFVVDDIRDALAEMQAAGLEIVGEPVWAADAFDEPGLGDFAWFFVRAPDGHVYAIEQVPD
jgi:catechol 2,3-dioxygenase-like lactoylglutathione lyase family enzyme